MTSTSVSPRQCPHALRRLSSEARFLTSTAAVFVLCATLASDTALARPWFPGPIKWQPSDAMGFAAADVNNDGHMDVIMVGKDFDEIRVHLGNGDGSFTTLDDFYSDDGPIDAAVADFDNDGHPDLALAKLLGDGGVSVLMGNGDGTFGPETDYVPGPYNELYSVSVGDFNGDHVPDLLGMGVSYPGGFAFLGNGDGTFEAFEVLGQEYFAGVADFDGDGLDDYAYPRGADDIGVHLSNGDGTFSYAGSFPVGDFPRAVTAGDVSGDGIPDLVAANFESDDISVLLGNGDGTFGAEQRYGLGVPPEEILQPFYIAIDDLDGDGLQDLVVANWWPSYPNPSLSLLYGTGGGQFTEAVTGDRMGYQAYSIAIADFDEDGAKDVVRPRMSGSWVGWLFGNGNGAFVTDRLEEVGESPADVAVGDLDGDGRLDLVTANTDSDDVSVLLADGAGTFYPEQRSCVVAAAPPCPPGSDPAALVIGEMTGDAHADLAVANAASDTISILAGDGAGGFSFVSSLIVSAGTSPSAIAIGDLDDDDEPDLVVVGEGSIRLNVFLGNGDGTFGPAPGLPAVTGTNPTAVALGMLDGDAHLDVVVANAGSGNVTVLLGDGDGTFRSAPTVPACSGPADVAVGDVNGDQIPDLAIANDGGNCLHVDLGNGDGSFGPPTILETLESGGWLDGPYNVIIADLDGDERADLATTTTEQLVFRGNGDGTFGAPHFYQGVGHPAVGGDFNLDARLDIAGCGGLGTVGIMPNQTGPGAFTFLADHATLVWPAVIGAVSYDLYRGDTSVLVDGDDDGLPDTGYGACMTGLDDDPRDTFFVDADTPSVGEGFFYLLSAIDAQGNGGIGATSAGLPRLPQVPCP
jgi:hypothetical protein